MEYPTFIVIGAQKSGTTSIYHYLHQHPQISMSIVKEPGFFACNEESMEFYGPGDDFEYRYVINDLISYQQLFHICPDQIAAGEATTWYLYSHTAAKKIYTHIPDVKLIAILRNPAERAYSAYMHAIRDGYEELHNFQEALEAEEFRIQQGWGFLWHYKNIGFYASQLKRYYNYFESSQMRVYLYDDFVDNPFEILRSIFQFLKVDETFVPDDLTRLNVSGIPRSRLLQSLLNNPSPIKSLIKPFITEAVKKQISEILRTRNLNKPECPLEIRNDLINIFHDDILALQDLIHRDLSIWLEQ